MSKCKMCGHTEESACFTNSLEYCDKCFKNSDKNQSTVTKCNPTQQWKSSIHITGINRAPSPEDMRCVIQAANRLGLDRNRITDVEIEIKGRKVAAIITLEKEKD